MAAGFGDGNDIKITATLDTSQAIASVEELRVSLEKTLEIGKKQFEDLAKASARINAVEVARIKSASAEKVAQLKLEKAAIDERTQADVKAQALIEAAAQKRADIAKRELAEIKNRAAERLNAQKIELNAQKIRLESTLRYLAELQKEGKMFRETEATKRAELQKTIALIKQQTQEIKRLSAGAGAGGSGGLFSSFGSGKQFSQLITSLGIVNSSTLSTIGTIVRFGGAIGAVVGIAYGTVRAINAVTEASNKLAAEAFKIEGLRTGFENLQRTVGNDPGVSLNALRAATQGLVADTELYQRANQAVLLGVPTDTFNAAASAAVKLGRAMGIDAASGLESLSLGLGRQSRLYLDNLGIIVSAEEAYKRFAASNNLVASQLSDGEKKAAFYAEALRKIYERAAELPDPIDSVAVSFKRLQAAQANLNQVGTEAFNNSVELASAYQRLTRATQDSTEASKGFSILFAELAAPFVRAKASLVDFITALKEGTLFLASFALPTTEAEQFAAAIERLAEAQRKSAVLGILGETAKAAEIEADGFKKVADSIAILTQKQATASKSTEAYARSIEVLKTQRAELGESDGKIARFLDQQIAQTESLARASQREVESIQANIDARRRELQERVAIAEQRVRVEEQSADSILGFENVLLSSIARRGGFGEALYANFVAEDAFRELRDAKEALSTFEGTYNQAKASAEQPITLRVDLSEVQEAASRLPNLFAELNRSALREAGIFSIPGVDAAALDGVKNQISETEKDFQLGALGADQYRQRLSELSGEFQKIIGEGYLKELSADIVELEDIQRSGAALTQEQSAQLDQLKRAYLGAAEGASASAAATEEAKVAFDAFRKSGQKAANDIQRDQKKLASSIQQESKKTANEYKKFVRDINRTFNQAIPRDLQARLTELFNTGEIGSKEFIDQLEKLGDEFIKTGGDVEALKKEIQALAKLKIENPLQPIKGDSQTTEELKKIKDSLSGSNIVNLKELFGGETSGGFFGFDIPGIEIGNQEQLAGQIQDSIGQIAQAGIDGFSTEDAPQIGGAVGAVLGAAIGASFGPVGVAVGASIGSLLGTAIGSALGGEVKGSKKVVKDFFGEVFKFEGLGVVVQRRVVDEVSAGIEGSQAQLQPVFERFSGLTYYNFSTGLGESLGSFVEVAKRTSQETLAFFDDVAAGLASVLETPDEAGNIFRSLVATLDGDLQNLQVTIQATGITLEDFEQKIISAFLNGYLSIEQAYSSLLKIQNLFEVGIPGAVGAFQQAIDNLNVSLQSDNPGRYAIDSLRDIGAEGAEAGASFQQVITSLAGTFNFSAQQMQLFFEAMRIAGIASLQQLQNASDAQLLTILENLRRIREGAAQTTNDLATVPALQQTAPKPISGGISDAERERQKAADEARRRIEEAYKLTLESQKYAEILRKIASGELTQVAAGREILRLRTELLRLLNRIAAVETAYQAELAKGANANRARLAKLAAQLDKLNTRYDDLAKKAKETTDATAKLDLAAIAPLIKSMNSLGVVSRQVGIELDKNVSILIKGFLQGRLSITEVNDEIKKTKDLLGPGIPGAIGAVTDAFQNLIKAGEQGGQFSVDAFVDIFAEFREKFQREGSALRKAEREQLVANVDAAREAFDRAVGPDAVARAQQVLDTAKRALEDFYAVQPKPDLSGLRSELERNFSKTEVDKFFQALDESGLRSFEDFEKAGADSVVGILSRLKELGFNFGITSDEIKKINKGLQDAEKKANGGFDPLQQAIDLVKQFNQGASSLPPVFDATTTAIGNLNRPLQQLANGFDNIIEKLARLSGNTFENDVVFNVRTVGDNTSRNLIEIIYGDGSTTGGDSGSSPGGDSSIREQIQRLRRELNRLVRRGQGGSSRADSLRDRIRRLRGELR